MLKLEIHESTAADLRAYLAEYDDASAKMLALLRSADSLGEDYDRARRAKDLAAVKVVAVVAVVLDINK